MEQAGDARERILSSAREVFAEHGYGGATMRGVAAGAGVDVALLYHYFGSKQRLFVAAMRLPLDLGAILSALLSGADGVPPGYGERLAAAVLGLWETPEVRSLLFGLVRSATTDPVAAGMLRDLIMAGPLASASQAIDDPRAELRAELAGSLLMGVAMVRYILQAEPIAGASIEELARVVGPSLERYLTGDLALPERPAAARG